MLKSYRTWLHYPRLALLLVCGLGFGLGKALQVATTELSNIFLLAILGAILSWNVSDYLPIKPLPRRLLDLILSWVAVTMAGLLALTAHHLQSFPLLHGACFLLALGIALRLGGLSGTLASLAPLVTSLLVLPHQEHLLLALSYPLRLLSTAISVFVLKLSFIDISHHLTSIRLGTSEVAITDACSGINQLAVMLLLGYVLVRSADNTRWWRFIHYLFLLPAIIIANSLRLIVSLLLYLRLGERAFLEPYHSWFGYAMVVVCVLLIWAVGFLLPPTPAEVSLQAASGSPPATTNENSGKKQ